MSYEKLQKFKGHCNGFLNRNMYVQTYIQIFAFDTAIIFFHIYVFQKKYEVKEKNFKIIILN